MDGEDCSVSSPLDSRGKVRPFAARALPELARLRGKAGRAYRSSPRREGKTIS